MYTTRKPAHLSLAKRGDEKPLPHRSFTHAPALESGQANEVDITEQRRPSNASTVSTIVLTPMKPTFATPTRPPRSHLPPHRIGQHKPCASYVASNPSKSLFYRTDSNLTSSVDHHFSGFPQTPHSLDYTNTKTSTAPLIPFNEKSPRSRQNFFRRHWFVLVITIATLLGIGLAIVAVMIKRKGSSREHAVYVPSDLTSVLDSAVTSLVADAVSTMVSDMPQITAVPI